MEFIIGVLMSMGGWLIGLIVCCVLAIFIGVKKKSVLLFFINGLIFIFIIASLLPSNTYKVKAEKQNNPIINQQHKEIQKTTPIIEQGKEERKERFDSLTNWKSRVQ